MKDNIRYTQHTGVQALDDVRTGQLHRRYIVFPSVLDVDGSLPSKWLSEINFQEGPRWQGINGCENEDLISIVMDRLECAQEGPLRCEAHAVALAGLSMALKALSGLNRPYDLENTVDSYQNHCEV